MQTKNRNLIIACAFALFAPATLCAQQAETALSPIAQLVASQRESTKAQYCTPFSYSEKNSREVQQLVPEGTALQLSIERTRQLWQEKPAYIVLSLPRQDQQAPLELELVLQSPFAAGFSVATSADEQQAVDYEPGAYYRGIIKGQPNTLAAVSIFEEEIIGLISTVDKGNLVLGRLEQPGNKTDYILYSDKNFRLPGNADCKAAPIRHTEQMRLQTTQPGIATSLAEKCMRVYLECDYAMYVNRGGVTATTNFITAVFNNVAVLYYNEQITTIISKILVWTTPDGYPTNNSLDALNAFTTNRPFFTGDVAHFVSFGGNNIGGVAWIDGLCQGYPHAYSNITASYATVPVFSQPVNLIAHEMGHTLGSMHTGDCVWNGNNTALDNCLNPPGCAPGPAPVNGGTIMSYCHLTGYGINFNNGFGVQPGNIIRSRVLSCVSGICVNGVVYCASSGNSNSLYIDKVKLGLVSNASGNNGGYGNYGYLIAYLAAGSAHTIKLVPGFVSTALTAYWRVWIDYNANGDFTDPGELVASAVSANDVSLPFTPPAGLTGVTRRMRIAVKHNGYPNSCGAIGFGEVEDYSVYLTKNSRNPVLSETGKDRQPADDGLYVYPNPAHQELNVQWQATAGEAAVLSLTDLNGRKVREIRIDGHSGANSYALPVNDLTPGVYLLQVRSSSYHYQEKVICH